VNSYKVLADVVLTLKQSVALFDKVNQGAQIVIEKNGHRYEFDREKIIYALRDSMVLRFKCSIDLLWKYLKEYLEIVLKVTLVVQGPKNIIRTCGTTGILTVAEVELAIQMIDDRNMTSHIYREEIAQIITQRIPEYCAFMELILQKTNPN
jgi:nucleotidyltransferase substrate binding protein (TIGR01987 family)